MIFEAETEPVFLENRAAIVHYQLIRRAALRGFRRAVTPAPFRVRENGTAAPIQTHRMAPYINADVSTASSIAEIVDCSKNRRI